MVESDEELHPQLVATPESIAIADEGQERLTRALETLPPRHREVLVLRELEGCSYKKIGAITSIPIGTNVLALPRLSSGTVRTHKSWLQGTFAWTVILPARPFMGISTMR